MGGENDAIEEVSEEEGDVLKSESHFDLRRYKARTVGRKSLEKKPRIE